METIKGIAKGIRILSATGAVVTLGLALVVNQPTEMRPNHTPDAAPTVNSSVMMEAANGRTCSPDPVLTDTIVVLDSKGTTRIMNFDDTYAAAQAGTVKVITYCK
jgi:hypothetical protein